MSDYPPPSTTPGPRAGFGQRLLAWLVDAVILFAVNGVLYTLLGRSASQGLGTLLGLAYYAFFEGGPAGQTPGKRVTNLRVVRADGSGAELGWGAAILRYVCRILSAIPCGLGYLWMLWDRRRQTWQDKLGETLVVRDPPPPQAPPPPSTVRRG